MAKIWLIVLIFLVIGAFLIKTNYDYDFDSKADQKNFALSFGRWLKTVTKNVWDVTGYAVKKDWLPDKPNISNSTEDTP